jgi:hypothetical protein
MAGFWSKPRLELVDRLPQLGSLCFGNPLRMGVQRRIISHHRLLEVLQLSPHCGNFLAEVPVRLFTHCRMDQLPASAASSSATSIMANSVLASGNGPVSQYFPNWKAWTCRSLRRSPLSLFKTFASTLEEPSWWLPPPTAHPVPGPFQSPCSRNAPAWLTFRRTFDERVRAAR